VGGTGPGDVSADYYGAFAEDVTGMLKARGQDPPFVAMMSNGTSGNINNINFREQREAAAPYVQIRKMAHLLAAEAWLQGTVSDAGAITMTGARNASLTGTIAGGKASGTVTAVGRQWTFTAPTVTAPSGLYRAAAQVRGAQVVGGWIVLANGEQVGMIDFGDHEESAPPLQGTAANLGGTPATAVRLDGTAL